MLVDYLGVLVKKQKEKNKIRKDERRKEGFIPLRHNAVLSSFQVKKRILFAKVNCD